MKRIVDRMGKAATKQSTSVQPFAGGILNKYKTGAGRKTFEGVAMSHVLKKEPNITQHTMHIQVVAPKAAVPNVSNNKKVPPIPERKHERVIIRERVTVEREKIVFRDVTHIIKEQRTVREIAIAQPAGGQETNAEAIQKTGILKQLSQVIESSKPTNTVKHDLSKRIIPQASLTPTQPLKAKQQADNYKWLQAKLQPGIVIQSIRKIEELRKPLVKERIQLMPALKQTNEKEVSKINSPLPLINARRAVISPEQHPAQGELTSKDIFNTIRKQEQTEAKKQEQRETERRGAAAQREAEKRAKAVKQEQRETESRGAAASRMQREAEKRAEAVKQEQRETESRGAAASRMQREAEKRAEAAGHERVEATSYTLRTHVNKQDNDGLTQAELARGNKQQPLEHRVNQKHLHEEAETLQAAATNKDKADIETNKDKADIETNVAVRKSNVSEALVTPYAKAAFSQPIIKLTARSLTEPSRKRLQTLVLQRKPQQLLDELNEQSSRSAIVAKRLIHRTNRLQLEQLRAGDNESIDNLNNNSTIHSVVPSNRKEIKAYPVNRSSGAISSMEMNETKRNYGAFTINSAQPGIQAGLSQRNLTTKGSTHTLLKTAGINNRYFAARPMQMVLRRFDLRQPAQRPETLLNEVDSEEAKASGMKRPAAQLNQRNKAKSDHYSEGIQSSQSRRAILHKRPSTPATQVITLGANITQNASSSASTIQIHATVKTEHLSKLAEGQTSELAVTMIDSKPVMVRGQLIARAASDKRPLLRNGVLLSHKRQYTSANADMYAMSTGFVRQNSLLGKRKAAAWPHSFSPLKANAIGESPAPFARRIVHRFAAEWLPSQTLNSSPHEVDESKQASASMSRKTTEQVSANTPKRYAAEPKPVASSLIQRQVRKGNRPSLDTAVNRDGVKPLNHKADEATQTLSKRLNGIAKVNDEVKASASMRAIPTLSVQRKLEAAGLKQQEQSLKYAEVSKREARANPVQRPALISSFLNSGSRAGVHQLRTVQRHSGYTTLAAKALVKKKPVFEPLTTVVQAGVEANPPVHTGSAAGDQVRLSYTAAARNRNIAGKAVSSGVEASSSSFGDRDAMPTLSHHKPSQSSVQEPPREVKVEAPRELDPEKLQKMIMKMPQLHPEAIADQVYKALERKMKLEQRRRGF